MSSIDFDDEINLSIGVTDIKRSAAFFKEHLGFATAFIDEKNGWATVATHQAGLTLGLSARESVAKGGGAIPTFGVKELARVRASLEEQGVRFDGPTVEIPGMTRFATFFDPDGNAFMLAEKLR